MEFSVVQTPKTLSESAPENRQYFYLEMPSRVRMLWEVPAGAAEKRRLPLQFGRQVACRVLRCPQRVFWKDCVVSPEQEHRLTNEFKEAFRPFDSVMRRVSALSKGE